MRVPDTIKRGRLSEDELTEIERLAGRGFSPGRVAQRMNRHPATISFAMHRLGLRTLSRVTRTPYVRNGVLVMPFSPEEDALVVSLRTDGRTCAAIGRAVAERSGHPRSAQTIRMRLVQLSNLEEAA